MANEGLLHKLDLFRRSIVLLDMLRRYNGLERR